MPERAKTIERVPISEIPDYGRSFYVVSSMTLGWAYAFINKQGDNWDPFGLPDDLLPPEGFQGKIYAVLSDAKEFYKDCFGFDSKSYLRFDGWTGRGQNPRLPEITQEGIRRFMLLSDREGEKTVITLDEYPQRFYCSDNLLLRKRKVGPRRSKNRLHSFI